MKTFLVVLLTVFFAATHNSFAAYYQWTDDNGVVHFTDNRDRIPNKYRKKAKKLKMSEEPRSTRGTPPVQVVPMGPTEQQKNNQPAPQQTAPQQPAQQPDAGPGGHSEQWWRRQFADLRAEMTVVQERLAGSRANLAQAQRKRAIYMRIQDREAVNAAQADVKADETRMNDLAARLEALSRDAASAGVPPEWRQ